VADWYVRLGSPLHFNHPYAITRIALEDGERGFAVVKGDCFQRRRGIVSDLFNIFGDYLPLRQCITVMVAY
jgi:hypothetical protein